LKAQGRAAATPVPPASASRMIVAPIAASAPAAIAPHSTPESELSTERSATRPVRRVAAIVRLLLRVAIGLVPEQSE
jgi:hypothetical protein